MDLRVFDIKKNEINGASKQYYVCHNDSKYKNNNKVINKVLNSEKKLKLADEKLLKNLSKKLIIQKKN